MNQSSESELLKLIQKDDRKAFATIVNLYSDILLRFIIRRISNEEEAKDMLQDIFLSLWNRRLSLVIEDSFYPFLFKAAQYKIIDLMLNKKKEILRKAELIDDFPLIGSNYTSEDYYMAKELEELVFAEVEKMPVNMRHAFQMSRLDAMSIKDISKTMSLSEQTIKNNISLVISRLRLKFK